MQVCLHLILLGLLAPRCQQMAQAGVTKIPRRNDWRGQAAQGMVPTLEGGCYRPGPVGTFREARGPPEHRRPPPTAPALRPRAGDRPVQHRRQAHLDHLPAEQGHTVAPLGDAHPVAWPKDLLGRLRHLPSHGPRRPQARAPWERAYQLPAMASKASRPATQAPSKNEAFGLFVRRMGRCVAHSKFIMENSQRKAAQNVC